MTLEPKQKSQLGHSIVADVKYLSKHAATVGAVIAVLCHLLPPHYRVVCDALASICKGETP